MPTPTSFAGLVKSLVDFINVLIPTLFGLVFLYVVWKIIDAWIIHAAEEQKREEGKKLVLVAVLMFALMLSSWGIITLVKTSIFG